MYCFSTRRYRIIFVNWKIEYLTLNSESELNRWALHWEIQCSKFHVMWKENEKLNSIVTGKTSRKEYRALMQTLRFPYCTEIEHHIIDFMFWPEFFFSNKQSLWWIHGKCNWGPVQFLMLMLPKTNKWIFL